jgi:hypothetical protein
MPNLENIHNTFFQKARVGSWGKKLIYLAWAIEIIVAGVSLSIAILFNTTDMLATRGPDTYVVVLALVVVAVMELTKIPLAIALYYSQRWLWRSLFVFLLLAANYSTIETMIQAFDLSYYNRLQTVDAEREKIENTREEINFLNSKLDTKKLNNDLENLDTQFKEASNAKTKIEIDRQRELTLLQDEYSVDNTFLSSLRVQTGDKKKERDQEKKLKEQAIKDKSQIKGGLFSGASALRKSLEDDIEKYQSNIDKLQRDIDELDKKYQRSLGKTSGKDEAKAQLINSKYNTLLVPIDQRINNLNKSIQNLTNELENVSGKTEQVNSEIEAQEEILIKQEKIAQKAMQANPIYRISLRIKNRPVIFGGDGGSYKITEVNQEDLDFAFTIWFGGLAFVISVIGTGVALAGLHLQDERLNISREKPVFRNLIRSFGKILFLINKYIWTSIKWLMKPKTKTIIEKVEVPVEKIVEKPVIEEKIVYQRVEVPKEIIKKEIVHHPLWTDDPDILKKEPFTIPKDKNKK